MFQLTLGVFEEFLTVLPLPGGWREWCLFLNQNLRICRIAEVFVGRIVGFDWSWAGIAGSLGVVQSTEIQRIKGMEFVCCGI